MASDHRSQLPFYRLPAASDLRTAGQLHGAAAAEQILAFLHTKEIASLVAFASSDSGSVALDKLRSASLECAPWLAAEIEGIADGAGVDVVAIWCVTLLSELQHAQLAAGSSAKKWRPGHCSDVISRCADRTVLLGHNEDWTPEWASLMYWVVYRPANGASFDPIGGLVYPGQPPGFAVTFTPTVWSSQNGLFPRAQAAHGYGIVAVVRQALREARAESVAELISRAGQALGMSVNVVQIGGAGDAAFAANVEVAGSANRSSVNRLAEAELAQLCHFNRYRYLEVEETLSPWLLETCARHQQVAEQTAPCCSRTDVASFLQGCREPTTMCAMVFRSGDGMLEVWQSESASFRDPPDWATSISELLAGSASDSD